VDGDARSHAALLFVFVPALGFVDGFKVVRGHD